ncbi:MAG: hypothetical protein M3509_09175 [Chloroflexota bacterium]|nr:hypothetical protein [Chloroflexota bacterium]
MPDLHAIDLLVIDHSWRQAEPGTIAGVLAMRGVANPGHHAAIDTIATELEVELRGQFAGQDRAAIQATPPYPAYAAYYKRFGQRYHVGMQLESVALKGKALPRGAALVAAMFLTELRHGILTAGHDLDALTLPITVAAGSGAESYTKPNGDAAIVKTDDIYTASDEGILSAIITGPSALARIGPATTAVLFVVYAPPGVAPGPVAAHVDALEANTRLIAPEAETSVRALAVAGDET